MASLSITWSGRRVQRWIKRYRNQQIVSPPVPGVSDADSVRVVSAMVVGARRFGATYTDAVMASGQHKWRDTGNELLSLFFGVRGSQEMGDGSNQCDSPCRTTHLLACTLVAASFQLDPMPSNSIVVSPEPSRNRRVDRGSALSNNVVNVTRPLAIASRVGGIHICTPRMRYLSPMGVLFRIPRLPLELAELN